MPLHTWWTLMLFLGALLALPWLAKQLRQRYLQPGHVADALQLLGSVPVGPQQRVLTLRVGPDAQATVLVLGVTAQQIQCLHVLPHTPCAQLPHDY